VVFSYKFESGFKHATSALIIITVEDADMYIVGKEYEFDVKIFLKK